MHFLVVGSTLFIYNLPVVLYGSGKARFYSYKGIMCYSGLLLAILASSQFGKDILWSLFLAGLLSVFYSVPVLPGPKWLRFREIGWLKTLDLAGVWTFATCILPIIYHKKSLMHYPIEIAQRFILIFVLCMLFDLRDLKTDSANQIETLPGKFGKKSSYLVMDCCIMLFIALGCAQFQRLMIPERLYGSIATGIFLKLVVEMLKKSTQKNIFILLGDGVMLFYAFCVLI